MAVSPGRLDRTDVRLLELLQDDAGQTLHDLGEQVGLSSSAVQRRIARYQRDGLVTKQVAVVDPQRLGPSVLATVLVTLTHESTEHHRAFTERMLATPAVQQCYAVAVSYTHLRAHET